MSLLKRGMAVLVVLAAGAWAYHANVAASRPAMDMTMRVTSGSTPFPVTLGPVERGPIRGTTVYTGSVAPFNEEDVYPRVTGRIMEMPVYPGDFVRAGQVVARLDDVELTSRVREAEAMVAAARSNWGQMEADVLAVRHGVAQMDRELAMAEADLAAARHGATGMLKELAMVEAEAGYQESLAAREERLFQSGAVSRQDVENVRAMATATRAKLQAAQAKADQGKAMVVAAEAKLAAAQAKLEQMRAMERAARKKLEAMEAMVSQAEAQSKTAQVVRDYVTIQATNTGYVVKRLVAPGVLVQPGMPLLKIAQTERVRLQANVGERDVTQIRVGSPVSVKRTGNGQAAFTARVTSVFPFVDPGARTAVVEAVVENSGRRLLPGQYVTMEFVIGERVNALTVPREAVARLGGKATVWVISGDQAESREVTAGLETTERVEILGGLAEGERIVRRGHEGLYTGARVAAVAPPVGSPAAGPAAPPAQTGPEPSAAVKEERMKGHEQPGATQKSEKKGGGHGAH